MAHAGAPRRVVLHVGTPKSGTTYLQRALWRHRDELAAHGVISVGASESAMFRAAVEVREAYEFWGMTRAELDGTWQRACQQARRHPGIAVMSHELLGAASAEQVERALSGLADVEVHLVVTARDLGRQATSEWQELIKNGGTRSFPRYARRIVRDIETGRFSSMFWRNQDLTGILGRWGANLPPERIHVVAPAPGTGDPHELWRAFASAAGFDGSLVLPDSDRLNASLGVAQIAVLREVNQVLDGTLSMGSYLRVVKERFAEEVLAAQPGEPLRCPPALAVRLRAVALERNAAILEAGYRVHGDLAHLVPVVPEEGPEGLKLGKPRPAQRQQAYVEALAVLLLEQARSERESRVRAVARRWRERGLPVRRTRP